MAFTEYMGNLIIDHLLRNQAHTPASTIYVSLWVGDPEGAGAEVTGSNYARAAVTLSAASSKASDNSADVEFNTPSGSWGTVTHFGLHDASTSGNAYFYAALSSSKAIGTDDPVKFLSGELDITLT
jgi:hypothetical protein